MRENNFGMERQRDGSYVKKGPWTAEEDGVLMNYVKRHGPRGWSSIRTMGLLPRTGKSCRLRWVNKLRPNLKSGCKFTVDEERIVIDLQAQFGNKWAKIATFLPGRTDNDVKNFWSARRKRLERFLQISQPKPQKINGKSLVLDNVFQISPGEGSSTCEEDQARVSGEGNSNLDALPSPTQNLPSSEFTSDYSSFPAFLPFEDLGPDPSDHGFEDMFERKEGSRNEQNLLINLPPEAGQGVKKTPETLDTVFDEFPADIFDCLEPLPISLEWQIDRNWNL